MTLSDLASLGSFVSALAVLVSLVFLYFQLRQISEQVQQAEKNQRAVLNQGYTDRGSENLRWYATPPLTGLLAQAREGETNFTPEETLRLSFAFRVQLSNTLDAYLQYRDGLMDRIVFDNAMLTLKASWLSRPAFRALWSQHRGTTSPEFSAVIDAAIAETALSTSGGHPTSLEPEAPKAMEQA